MGLVGPDFGVLSQHQYLGTVKDGVPNLKAAADTVSFRVGPPSFLHHRSVMNDDPARAQHHPAGGTVSEASTNRMPVI